MEKKIFIDETLKVEEVQKPKIRNNSENGKIEINPKSINNELSVKEIFETFISYGNGIVDLIPTQKANSGICKYCGKPTSKKERHLCVDCFKENAKALYEKLYKTVM